MQRIKNWKTIYKQDINSKIKESEQEFDKYKLTRKSIYLRQAENKMFSAVKTFLMIKHNRRARSYQELTRIVKNDKRDRRLLKLSVKSGSELNYKKVREIIKNRMRN